MTPSSPSDHVTLFSLIAELQAHGTFTYGELAERVAARLGIPLLIAQRSVLQVAADVYGLFAEDIMIDDNEPASPSNAETVAGWKSWMAQLRPKPKAMHEWKPPRNGTIAIELFEHYRPQPSRAKWLREAPAYVMGCFDNPEQPNRQYTVVFGDWLWTAEYAYANWQSGLNPRLAPCLRMGQNPAESSLWLDCLRTRYLGRKIRWTDLPDVIRSHVVARVSLIKRSDHA